MVKLAKKLSEFSICYKKLHTIYLKKIGLPEDFKKIKSDPFLASLYFTVFVHERPGVNPDFQRFHRIAIRKSLNGSDFSTKLLTDKDFPERVWKNFKELTNNRPNAKITKGVVRDILEEMHKASEPNVIKLLGGMSIKKAHEFLLGIRGISNKLSAFILRDLQNFFKLWKVPTSDLYRLQPVDRWVRRFSELCWPYKLWTDKHDQNAKIIVECCVKCGIDPICFNQGAWFVGSHYTDLYRYHKISEDESIDLVSCVLRFDKDKVMKGIEEYEKKIDVIFVV